MIPPVVDGYHQECLRLICDTWIPWDEDEMELYASLMPDLVDQYHGYLVQRLIAHALVGRAVRRTPGASHPFAKRTALARQELRAVRSAMRRNGIPFTETPAKHLRIMAGMPPGDSLPFPIFGDYHA